jgi:hypothetical protein
MQLIDVVVVWIIPAVVILGLGLIIVGLVVWRWW